MPMSQFQSVYESLLTDYESMKREGRDKVRENLEAEQKGRGRRKVGRLGGSPTLFVPSTLLLFLCPRSAVPSSRESAGRTTSVRNFTKQRRNPVILHRLCQRHKRWLLFKIFMSQTLWKKGWNSLRKISQISARELHNRTAHIQLMKSTSLIANKGGVGGGGTQSLLSGVNGSVFHMEFILLLLLWFQFKRWQMTTMMTSLSAWKLRFNHKFNVPLTSKLTSCV